MNPKRGLMDSFNTAELPDLEAQITRLWDILAFPMRLLPNDAPQWWQYIMDNETYCS